MHSWNLKPEAAAALQTELAKQVIRKSRRRLEQLTTVAGIDTGYRNDTACAAVVVLNLANLAILEKATASKPVAFRYVPGLLTFREGPLILAALKKLKSAPDLLMIDGQGIAHPRRCGIASHIGVLTGTAAIGCAKTKLWGDYQEPEQAAGSTAYLTDRGETIGAAVRTRTAVRPVFVSIGHLIDLNDSIRIVLKCCRGYRLPEPIRQADRLSRKQIKNRSAPKK